MSTKFAVVSIWAEDVAATMHFYRDVLGLDLLSEPGSHPHFEIAGVYLTILKGSPASTKDARPDRFPLFALAVEDLDAMLDRLEKHHVPLPWGVESNAGERWVMFRDPAGNLIELVQREG